MSQPPETVFERPSIPRLLAISSMLAFAGCVSPMTMATRAPQPLAYVGTVSLGQPTRHERHLSVPLRYSDGEWVINSVLFPYTVDARVAAGTIELTVVFAVAKAEQRKAAHELRLPKNLKGRYRVVYRDPDGTLHPLQEIDL